MNKLVTAVVIGVIAWIVAYLLGTLLMATTQPFVALGAAIRDFAVLIGLLCGVANYFVGKPSF